MSNQIPTDRPRVAMLQDGARLHYAVPIALQRAGILERVFADWFNAPGSLESLASSVLSHLRPALAQKMAGRFHPELDLSRIVRNRRLTLLLQLAAGKFDTTELYYRHVAHELSRWVIKRGWGAANAFMAFISNAHPILFQACRAGGLATVGDQILAPVSLQMAEAQIQAERFAEWSPPGRSEMEGLAVAQELERQTWPLLDRITCASDYVRDGLIAEGIEPQKVRVIPYPIDAREYEFVERANRSGPITVGFVGALNLRKGVPYFLQVAGRFDPQRIKFVMVGPIQVDPAALAQHKGAVQIVGQVPRSEVSAYLKQFDILLFPSTCEGSAGAVMEAMASGLPVIASPNSGTVARHGIEGIIGRYDDIDGMATQVERLADDKELRLSMGRAARQRVEQFSLDWYSRELATLFKQLMAGRQRPKPGDSSPQR